MKKNAKRFFMWMLMFVIWISGSTAINKIAPQKAEAKKAANTAYVKLKFNTEYSQYDVTGDGEPDRVVIKQVKDKEDEMDGKDITLKVFINDQIAWQEKEGFDPYWVVHLIRLANGKIVFEICAGVAGGSSFHGLYACNKGKLKNVYQLLYYKKYAYDYEVRIENISGNTIKTRVDAQFYTTGSLPFNMDIKYKDGKFIRTSNKFVPDYKEMIQRGHKKNKWTVNRKIKVYKKVGSKKIAYTLKKGDIIKINKIIYKNKKVYFLVKNKNGRGKKGYIPATKDTKAALEDKNYFKECQFAG